MSPVAMRPRWLSPHTPWGWAVVATRALRPPLGKLQTRCITPAPWQREGARWVLAVPPALAQCLPFQRLHRLMTSHQ